MHSTETFEGEFYYTILNNLAYNLALRLQKTKCGATYNIETISKNIYYYYLFIYFWFR